MNVHIHQWVTKHICSQITPIYCVCRHNWFRFMRSHRSAPDKKKPAADFSGRVCDVAVVSVYLARRFHFPDPCPETAFAHDRSIGMPAVGPELCPYDAWVSVRITLKANDLASLGTLTRSGRPPLARRKVDGLGFFYHDAVYRLGNCDTSKIILVLT